VRLAAGIGKRLFPRVASSFAVSMSPHQWALCVAVGIVLGVFPAPACPTLLCAAAALALRLNPPVLQAMNYLAWPLQLALFGPLARLGERLLHQASKAEAAAGASGMQVAWSAAAGAAFASAHAIAAWLLVCAPVAILLYALARPVFRRVMRAA
jgi:hypothetical protein